MKTQLRISKRNLNVSFVLGLVSLFFLAAATMAEKADIKDDEQAIRSLVEKQNGNPNASTIKYTDDRIFVSGLFPRPLVGKSDSEETILIREKAKKERLNFSAVNRIERLVVARGGDMAYEFGYGTLNWDTPDQEHITLDSSYLRVWRKVKDQWQVDAMCARPNR